MKHLMQNFQQEIKVIEEEMQWFQQILQIRVDGYFQSSQIKGNPWDLIPAPQYDSQRSKYGKLIHDYQFQVQERLVLMLALAPEIYPQALDLLFTKNTNFDRGFTEFGGILGQRHGGFLPTIQTAFFLLAGDDLYSRIQSESLFDQDHPFFREHILSLPPASAESYGEPFGATPLRFSDLWLDTLIREKERLPDQQAFFPAKLLTTSMEWEDLVLDFYTQESLKELQAWLKHHPSLNDEHWKLERRLKGGYRCLFYGPPGTGKTLTASLLGKITQQPVYRIDLSQIVSKWIGETEKNLENLFYQAERRNWILFFDEADTLFGQRTGISSSNDRYANQGTSYLLQRIEDYPSVIILATNLKNNIDGAFTRRFQSMIYFPLPDQQDRLRLWQQTLDPSLLAEGIDLQVFSEKYELTGANIVNITRYATLMAIEKNQKQLQASDLNWVILRELEKEGSTL